jgi:RNA polymerase sigma-70 factor (ECF subfamily)
LDGEHTEEPAWTRATRERRNTPASDAWLATVADEPAVDPDRFFGLENPALVDRWASAPRGVAPEEQLLASETQAIISRAIEALPLAQREVITLRDIEGWSAADVCRPHEPITSRTRDEALAIFRAWKAERG